MGFSIGSTQNNSTMLAEILPGDGGEAIEVEQTLEQVAEQVAARGQTPQGTLKGEVRQFTFTGPLPNSDLPAKFSDNLLQMHRPQQFKPADPHRHLKFEEKSVIKEKVFTAVKSESKPPLGDTAEQKNSSPKHAETHVKASHTATQALKESKTPPSPAQIRANTLQHQQNTSRVLKEQRTHQESPSKPTEKEKEKASERKNAPESTRGALREKETSDKPSIDKQQEQQKEQEEGFAGGGQHQQEQGDDTGSSSGKQRSSAIDPVISKEFSRYSAEDSILSEILGMRISQFDVLVLFIEIMKLDVKSREQQKLARREERELQIMHMQNVVENYKQQADWQLFSSLGAGMLGIVSGLAPIVGHVKGEWIIEKIGGISFLSGLRDMKKDVLFKNIAKLTANMSEMQKSVDQIQHTFAESSRTYDEHMSSIYRSDWDESTRTMDEIKDDWKSIENFLHQTLQMYHDAIRSLYS